LKIIIEQRTDDRRQTIDDESRYFRRLLSAIRHLVKP